MSDYFDEIEYELFQYDDDDLQEDAEIKIDQEEWQDMNSEDLLNVWFTIIEYHEENYLPLRKTFNQMCEFVYKEPTYEEIVPEIQAIRNHPFVKDRNWMEFFSLE